MLIPLPTRRFDASPFRLKFKQRAHAMDQHQNQLNPDNSSDPHPNDAQQHKPQESSTASAPLQENHGGNHAGPTDSNGDVLDLIAQVDEQLKRIRDAQQAQDEGLTTLAERFHQLEESEKKLQQESESLRTDREAIARQREEIERLQGELARTRESWENEQRERESQINSQREDVQRREGEVSRRTEELKTQADQLRQREEQLQNHREALDQERDELQRRVERAENNLAETENRMNEIAQRLAATEQERDSLCEQLATQKRQLDLAGEKLREFAAALKEQNAQVSQGASAMVLVKKQEQTIAELQQKLTESRTHDEQSAQQSDQLAEQIRERDQKIQSLTDTIESLRSELAELNTTRSNDESLTEEHEAQVQSLNDRISELELKLTEAKEALQKARQRERQRALELPDSQQQAADALRKKAKRIAQVATHVRRRRRRLQRVRAILREQSGNAHSRAAGSSATHEQYETIKQQMQEIEHQRRQLRDMHATLAATEQRMIRKWARPRAISLLFGLLALLLVNVAAAWALANYFAPAERSASITIEPRTAAGRALEPDEARRWQQWHATIVQDESFVRAIAQRLRERRLDAYGDPNQLEAVFRNNLTVDTGPGGQVTYTLAGHNRAEITGVLDVLASTLMIESERSMGSRGDRTSTVVLNERRQGKSMHYAMMNAWTLNDNRVMWMLPILVATILLTVTALRLIYTRLIQAKQLFDEATSVIED
jgi:hypothetical protein